MPYYVACVLVSHFLHLVVVVVSVWCLLFITSRIKDTFNVIAMYKQSIYLQYKCQIMP